MVKCIFSVYRFFQIFLLSTLITQSSLKAQDKNTEILWDNYGVPHIYATSVEQMYYGFGWAQMHNHANLLLQLYGQARGRAAEYWGEGFLQSDITLHLFRIPEESVKHYKEQTPESKKYLDAFVAGMNAYAIQHPGQIGDSYKQVLPLTPMDVLAHGTRVVCLLFLGSDDLWSATQAAAPGSNALAIGPSRSASGNAMLMANPHLPWQDLFLFFEAHLNAPGFSAYGACLIGQPVLNIAFNNYLGWTHTVNTIDASDWYELSEKDNGYILDGKVHPFEKRTCVIKIRQADQSLKEQVDTFKYSVQGPIVGEKNGKAQALRIAGINNPNIATEWHAMAKARNRTEFENALKMMQIPMFNVIYADRAGDILYLFNGNIPVRSSGDWQFWSQKIDGSSSRNIWKTIHPYKDLPRVLNPLSGFVHNSNDPPWTCTFPTILHHEDFPGYMSPNFPTPFRAQRGVNMVLKNDKISFDDLVKIKMNTGPETADRFLDDLLAAVTKYPDTAVTEAATVLRTWDKQTDSASKGAILFIQWFNDLLTWQMKSNVGEIYAIPWNEKNPFATPRGIKDPRKAVELLAQAAKEVREQYGRMDIAWGEVNRFRINGIDFAGNGGTSDPFGIYRAIFFTPGQDNKNMAVGGDSYVAVVEFGKKVKAKVCLSYGNSSQPGNKHLSDQLGLMSGKQLRNALLDKDEILKNLEEKELLKKKN
jgi:acyl-homoserine-lactone acylase